LRPGYDPVELYSQEGSPEVWLQNHAVTVLVKNFSLNQNIKRPMVEMCACSDEIGEAILFTRDGNSRSSLVPSVVESSTKKKPEEIRVPIVTLDSYLLEHRLAPRCVKIDAEGAEIRILKGAKQVLASNADIVCELHP
jgi:FkbM family methyltransferase